MTSVNVILNTTIFFYDAWTSLRSILKKVKIKCNWNGAFFSCFIHTSLSKKLSKKNDETRYKTAYHKRTWGNNQFSIKRTSFDVKKDIDIGWLLCVYVCMWWRRGKKIHLKCLARRWNGKASVKGCVCVCQTGHCLALNSEC